MELNAQLHIVHIVSGDLWGGAEAQVHTLCKYLSRDISVKVSVVILNEGELRNRLEHEGITTYLLDERKLSAMQIWFGMRRLFLQLRPDVIHTHREKENILASVANQLSVRAPSVRTQHGAPEFDYSWRQPHKKLQAALDRFCGRYLQRKVIAVSGELADKLSTVFAKDHLVTIENGVDIERYQGQTALAPFKLEKPNVKHIGICGRLVPVKRVDLFLEAAALMSSTTQIKEQVNEEAFAFHVIGDGPLRSQLEAQARGLGLNDVLTFHGHCQDVASIIYSLDVLLMCSDHEGLPMTLLEAMALGTPIVGHHAGALTEFLKSGNGGRLATSHSPEGYSSALAAILSSESLRDDAVRKGGALVKSKFTATNNAVRILGVYQSVLKSTPKLAR